MINLEKKKSINLKKAEPSLGGVKVGLSWDQVIINGNSPDADASAFLLGENGKILSEDYFVFYNNTISGDRSVSHSGDNRDGRADGDDEVISIDFDAVNPNVVQILFVITINNISDGFHFGNIKNSAVRVYNSNNNSTLCQYQLTESFDGCDSLIIGRFYRVNNEWEFEALGQAFTGGLEATLSLYS